MEFLNSRARQLAAITRHDIATRPLKGKANTQARGSLVSNTDIVQRRIAYVVLRKALFLFYFVEGKEHIAVNISLASLFERASNILLSTDLDEHVLEQLGHSMAEVRAASLSNQNHWVEVAVRMTHGLSDVEKDNLVAPMGDLHDRLVLRMQAH